MALFDKKKDSDPKVGPEVQPFTALQPEVSAPMPEAPKTPSAPITHTFPLRINPDLDIEMKLPRDLTGDDVERIYKWLQAVAVNDRTKPPSFQPGPKLG